MYSEEAKNSKEKSVELSRDWALSDLTVSLLNKISQLIRYVLFRLMLLTSGILFSLLTLEIALRLILPSAPVTNSPKEFLASNKIGYKPLAHWTVTEPEFTQKVAINSLGYRDQEIDLTRPAVIFLGDSQTFGTGVNFGERASDRVREMLAERCGTEHAPGVLNVAMPGASTFDEKRFLNDILKKGVKPLHVFLMLSTNDHYANLHDEDDPVDKDVEDKATKRSASSKFIREYRYKIRIVQLLMSRLAQSDWFQSFYSEIKADLGLGELMALRSLYTDEQSARTQIGATQLAIESLAKIVPLTVVSVPDRYRVNPMLRDVAESELAERVVSRTLIDMDRESRLLREMAGKSRFQYIDPNPEFSDAADPGSLAYPINGHLTIAGQTLLAKIIGDRSEFLRNACVP